MKTFVVTHLCETVLMRGHNICFYGEIGKTILKVVIITDLGQRQKSA